MPSDPFYASLAWRTLRRAALKRDRYRCTLCRADLHKLGSSRVDHLLPRSRFPALALDLGNLRSLCAACDNRQAIARLENRAPRFTAVDELGQPATWRVDPASEK